VEAGNSFHLRCLPNDRLIDGGGFWYIFFSLTSIVCQVYPAKSDVDATIADCTDSYDIKRFKAYRKGYVLLLDVTNATKNDAGLYVCARPNYKNGNGTILGNLGLLAVVGVVCEL